MHTGVDQGRCKEGGGLGLGSKEWQGVPDAPGPQKYKKKKNRVF